MAKISVIGICGNSIFLSVDHFHQKGETVVAKKCFEEIGGKGINQAIAAARMGADVSFLAAIGDDSDGIACKLITDKENIKGCFAVKGDTKTTFAFILTDSEGENQVTEYIGAELTVQDVMNFENEIKESDILLIQQEVPNLVNKTAVALAEKHGVKVILNPAPIREISDNIAKTVFLVTPNEQESKAIDISDYKNCITTLGNKGACINGKTIIPAPKVTAVDTTGAGDTFNGVLAVLLAEGKDLDLACRYAVAAATISVTKPNVLNAIPTKSDIEKFSKENFNE